MIETPPTFACNDAIAAHLRLLRDSYQRVTGHPLVNASWTDLDDEALCAAFWNADAVIASHGVEDDPVLNYGNRRALELWEADWPAFTSMPSRLTAEPIRREERAVRSVRPPMVRAKDCPRCGAAERVYYRTGIGFWGSWLVLHLLRWVRIGRMVCLACGFCEEWLSPYGVEVLRRRHGLPSRRLAEELGSEPPAR